MSKFIQKDDRHCIISPNGGNLTICLTVNNGLRAGAVFWLWARDENGRWTQRKGWELITGDTGRGCIELDIPVSSLERNAISWRINTCSFIPALDSGIIEIHLIQDNVSCQLTRPMQWSLTGVKQCSQDAGKKIESVVHILFK